MSLEFMYQLLPETVRKDDVFDRLQKEFNDLACKSPVWHPNCYKCYTSKHSLELLEQRNLKKKNEASAKTARELPEVQLPKVQTRRTSGVVIDWSECLIFQKVYYEKDNDLVQVITFPVTDLPLPLTWKTWKSQGIRKRPLKIRDLPKKSGNLRQNSKSQGKVREFCFSNSFSAKLKILILKIFWGSMPPDRPKLSRTHGRA